MSTTVETLHRAVLLVVAAIVLPLASRMESGLGIDLGLSAAVAVSGRQFFRLFSKFCESFYLTIDFKWNWKYTKEPVNVCKSAYYSVLTTVQPPRHIGPFSKL